MKKVVLIFLFFIGLIFSFSTAKAESKLPTWEFLPIGINYLDPNNVWYKPIDGGNRGNIQTISKFRVLPNTEYRIYKINNKDVEFNNANIFQYDEYGDNVFSSDNEVTVVNYDDLFIGFQTESDTYYLSFCIEVVNDGGSDIHVWDIEDNFYMIDASMIDGLDTYDYNYLGADLEDNIQLGDTIYMETNISNPIEMESIDNALIIYDFTDDIITSQKQIVSNTYNTKDVEVGEYEIKYSVTNSLNLTTYLTINIKVNDDISPVITGNTEYTMSSVDLKTLDDVKATLTARDNVDGDISSSILVDSTKDNFTNRTTKYGVYPVTFYVIDSVGNKSELTVNVNVIKGDNTGPVFSGSFEQTFSTSSPKTIEEIMSDITAIDDYSGNVTDRIEVIYNEYMYNTNKKGIYTITLQVIDDDGNVTTRDIRITVVENSYPIFVLKPISVYLPLKTNMESIDDVITLLQKTGYLNDSTILVTSDGYSENKNALGSYKITLEQEDVEYNIVVNVEEQTQYLANIELPKNIEKVETILPKNKFLKMIYNVCSSVKAFFKDFFSTLF